MRDPISDADIFFKKSGQLKNYMNQIKMLSLSFSKKLFYVFYFYEMWTTSLGCPHFQKDICIICLEKMLSAFSFEGHFPKYTSNASP